MYPITYNFKKIALANKVTATDSTGKVVLYAHQEMFKLKEKILLFADSEKTIPVGELNADRVIDFSPVQTFTDTQGNAKLSVKRNGKKSIWKANYEIIDANNVSCFIVREDNAWVKVMDALLGEIPFVGIFSGYFFNPKYNIFDSQGHKVGQIVKEPSLLESNYKLNLDQPQVDAQGLLPVSVMTIITRERARG